MRSISEFIAALILIVITVVTTIFLYGYVGRTMLATRPSVRYLEASVVSVDVLYQGPPIAVQVSQSQQTFTASYIYKLTVVLRNSGSQMVQGLAYKVVQTDQSITVCTSDSCTVYDPLAYYSENLVGGSYLYHEIMPNEVITFTFVVLSKVDLLSRSTTPFVIEISGQLPDGTLVSTSFSLKG